MNHHSSGAMMFAAASLVLLALNACATSIEFSPATLDIAKDAATSVDFGILIKDVPAGKEVKGASFYLVWDKTALTIDTPAWDTSIFDFAPPAIEKADGRVYSATQFSGTGSVTDTSPILNLKVKPTGAVTGNVVIAFKVADTNLNKITDQVAQPIDAATATWGTLTVNVTEGPPDPVQGLDSVTFAPRQKDDVVVNVAWTAAGKADNIELQHSDDGGATWEDVDNEVVDIANKKVTVTTGVVGTETVKVRARATDQGQVWDGTAAVDAATNPDAGWTEGATDLTIDNEAPAPQSAATNLAGDTITVNFQADEILDDTTSVDPANYELGENAGVTSAQAGGIPNITGVTRISDTAVEVALDDVLDRETSYWVGSRNVADSVGNASGDLQQVNVTLTPYPVRNVQVAVDERVKDPVQGTITLGEGYAGDGEARYSTDGGATWTPFDPQFTDDAFEWNSGLAGTQTVTIGLRGFDQGKVWDGNAAVDPVANPEAGWHEETFILDNEAPHPMSAAGAGNMVEIAFQSDEALNAVDVQTTGHYTVMDMGVITADQGDIITVQSAALKAGTKNVIELQLATALVATEKYQVSVQNVQDAVGNAMADTVDLDVQTEPKPGKNVAVALDAGTTQKDDVVVNVTWADGFATELQLQSSTDGGATWSNVTPAATDISAGTGSITWSTGITGVQAVKVRARVVHRGMVWDGTQNQDAATNPDVGWSAAADLTVDNEAPTVDSIVAVRGESTVTVNFQAGETLDQATAETAANYTVTYEGPVTANGATQLDITNAVLQAANIVKLTLGEAFGVGRYKVVVNAAMDTAGNVLAAPVEQDFTFKPNPEVEAAEFVAKNQVSVTFDKEMELSTLNTGAEWNIATVVITDVDTAATVAVQSVADSGDKKTFILTTDVMDQKTNYTVTAPEHAEDTEGLEVAANARTANFATRRWFDFADGMHMIGVPLTDAGRVRDMTGAAGIAAWDTGAADYIIDSPATANQIMNEAGKGFFAKFNGATTGYFDGDPLAGAVGVNADAGWSIIAPPRNMTLNNINPAIPYAWYYGAAGYMLKANLPPDALPPNTPADANLDAWKSYFIKRSTAGNIQVGTAQTQDVQTLSVGGDDAKLVQFVVQAGNAVDAMNYCGIGDSEDVVANPPLVDGSVDLAFVGKDGQANAIDVRTGDVSQTWDMVVTTSLPNAKITVAAPDLSSVPAEYAVTLTDKSNGKSCYLRTSQGYTFESDADGAVREFSVEIARRAAGSLVNTVSVQAAPGNKAVVTYGLNSTAAVTADVLNIAGRRVCRIVADRVESAGTHSLVWNLNSDAGTAVPRGLYMIVVQARSEDGQQVKAVRPLSVNR